jgi:hypothetical protein
MNKAYFFIVASLLQLNAFSQNIDSFLRNPAPLELSISNPQPRLGEEFIISYDPGYINAQIFKSALGKLQSSGESLNSTEREVKIAVKSAKLGKEVLGPFNFTINGVACKTNQLQYEVVEKLPETAEGVWIRKVKTSDSTFCILLEQRIPTESKTEQIAPNQTRYWMEPVSSNQAKINTGHQENGVSSNTSTSYSGERSLYTASGKQLTFQFIFSIANFDINDRSARIEITKDWFENLPRNFKFENIKVQ